MEATLNQDKALRSKIIQELVNFGCCNLCILRYTGYTDPYIFRQDEAAIAKLLFAGIDDPVKKDEISISNGNGKEEESVEPCAKLLKRSPCTSCLGLLDEYYGTSDAVLDKIAGALKEENIQAKSYTINLSLPISIQFRAYFVWYRLMEKFPQVYESCPNLKPEGTSLKNVWKWICTGRLKNKVDPDSDWVTEGCLTVNVTLKYDGDETECTHLSAQFKKTEKLSKKSDISRSNIDGMLKDISPFDFKRKFGDSPTVAPNHVIVDKITCVHIPLYLAGRYNKYSRKVSQTPWFIDGKRFHENSVEELIMEHVLPLMQTDQAKFSASGREDVDVRMLGRGRPFVMEIIQPKRTLFSQEDILALRNRINQNTDLIKVQDLQIVDRKSASKIKEGEESKTKNYCALCLIPGKENTTDIIDKLNSIPVPLVLQQKTPIRVLHRRSLATRERSIYSINAVPGKSPGLFKLNLKTQAGTYVKEFVHGDLGRTTPSIAELLKCNADIVSLDVESVDFPWPPKID